MYIMSYIRFTFSINHMPSMSLNFSMWRAPCANYMCCVWKGCIGMR